ncbi:MAG: hypothetical protein F4Z00_04050 [Acidimicrobiaceae bacterium]|nr:hypothetical protein [Acidimicrobiaceae bacterium]MYF41679.1 hypothetical protein [Acidimicrobiaceae bacterium]
MDTSTLDFNTLTLLLAIVGSTLTIVTLMFRQSNRHDDSIKALGTDVAALGTRVTALEVKVDALDTKLTDLVGKTEEMGRDVSDSRERLARVEGHLLAPGGFTLRHSSQRDAGEPPRDNPSPGHQEAG